jgi:hypothetical protein
MSRSRIHVSISEEDPDLRGLQRLAPVRQAGEHGGGPAALEEVHNPKDHRPHILLGPGGADARQWVHDDRVRVEVRDLLVHHRQVRLQAVQAGTRGEDLERAGLDQRGQVQADGPHVPHDLLGRFLEREVQAPPLAHAGGPGEMGPQARLAAPGGSGHEDRTAAEKALDVEHAVQVRDTGGDALVGPLVGQPRGGDGHDRDARGLDDEGILVGPVRRAAVLDHAEAASGDLLDHPVVQQHHAVRDVLLKTLTRELAVAALAGDHRRNTPLLEPHEQAAQLGPEHRGVGQAREQGLDGVQHDAPGADRVDGVPQADEQAVQVVLPRLLDLAALDAHVVQQDQLALDHVLQREAQRGHVADELLGPLLE